MPLVPYSLRVVWDTLRDLDREPKSRLGKVLTLSHPDVIASPVDIDCIFGEGFAARLPQRGDSAGSVNWHKARALVGPGKSIPDTAALFKALGYEMTAVDVTEGRGGEDPWDLSEPLPARFHHAYDFVFDCVSNQVFNVAQALANAAAAARVGGYVLTVVPVSMINQGFWNVSPCAFHDFYAANGFELVRREAVYGVYEDRGRIEIEAVRRRRGVPDDVMNLVLARKVAHYARPVWPVMAKFHAHPTCQIHDPAESPL